MLLKKKRLWKFILGIGLSLAAVDYLLWIYAVKPEWAPTTTLSYVDRGACNIDNVAPGQKYSLNQACFDQTSLCGITALFNDFSDECLVRRRAEIEECGISSLKAPTMLPASDRPLTLGVDTSIAKALGPKWRGEKFLCYFGASSFDGFSASECFTCDLTRSYERKEQNEFLLYRPLESILSACSIALIGLALFALVLFRRSSAVAVIAKDKTSRLVSWLNEGDEL